jgi:hypothetical protein
MKTMNPNKTMTFLLLLSTTGISGFAISADNKPTNNHGTAAEPAAVSVSGKTAKKISTAIGEEVEDFVVTKQEEIEAPTGFKGIEYTVETNGGKKFKCEVLEPSKAGRIMSYGMSTGGDAMCTDFTKGSKGKGKANQASCSALLRAAGKCT